MPIPVTVSYGRWATRSNRVVDIDSFRFDELPPVTPGAGVRRVKVWSGIMRKANGEADGRYEWTEAGNFRNPQGVTNTHDLVYCIQAQAEPQPAA